MNNTKEVNLSEIEKVLNMNKAVMTNDSVRGYVTRAMLNLDYPKEKIEEVIDELHWVFDTMSESEAEQFYYNPFRYEKNEEEEENE